MDNINEETIQELEDLFYLTPPGELRECLLAVFFRYIEGLHNDLMPTDFKKNCENVQFLANFLQAAEKHEK